MKAITTAAVVAIAAIVLAPGAVADKYSDADTAFIAAVASGIGAGSKQYPLIDSAMMDRLIADGHKVCHLMDADQWDVIDPYIQQKYDTPQGTYTNVYYTTLSKFCPEYCDGVEC